MKEGIKKYHVPASREFMLSLEKYGRSMKNSVILRKERGFAMFGFLTFGTTLTFLDQALKKYIEEQDSEDFPKELNGSKGLIWLYKNHNPGFSFGILEGSRAVELVPLCAVSAIAGAWTYLMRTRGRIMEKMALTLTLAGGASNVYDRMKRGYVVDYFNVRRKALKKVVFNLGDIFVLAGAALMVLANLADMIKDRKKES